MISFRWNTSARGFMRKRILHIDGKPKIPPLNTFRLFGVMFSRTFVGVIKQESGSHD